MGVIKLNQKDKEALEPVRAYWNTLATQAPEGCRDHWVDEQGRPLAEDLYGQVAAYVIRQIPKNAAHSPTILEIGCGTGRILAALQKEVPSANLWGIDVSDEQIRDAKTRLKTVQLHSLDVDNLLKEQGVTLTGIFDCVYLHGVTQYFPSDLYFEEVLKNSTILLKPGGVLCLMDVPVDWYYEQMRGLPKVTMLTPIKTLVKKIIGYKPKERRGPTFATEFLNGKPVEAPVFKGYWANPSMIEAFSKLNYNSFLMLYQPFTAKPIIYRKYRPIFILRGKVEGAPQ